MTAQHTPGPWTFEPSRDAGYTVLWNQETRQEVLVTGGFNDGDTPVTWMGEELSPADRSLIESAPLLLAVLKKASDLLDDNWQTITDTMTKNELTRAREICQEIDDVLKATKGAA